MKNVTKVIKPIVSTVSNTKLVTHIKLPMRKPYNEKGEWIGWTNEEVMNHLKTYKLSTDKKADNLIVVHP